MTKNILINQLKVDPKSNIPLHKQVEALIRKLISQREFREGKLLPKEVDLSRILGISRNTIRQATNKLVHEKLLKTLLRIKILLRKFRLSRIRRFQNSADFGNHWMFATFQC